MGVLFNRFLHTVSLFLVYEKKGFFNKPVDTCLFIVDSLKSKVTKKKGRGFGGETHGDVKEYEGLDSSADADNPNAPQRYLYG